MGLTGVLAPKSVGGQGASFLAAAKVLEELAGACFAFTFGLWVHNNMLNTVARNGTPEQIARYVPPMLAGERNRRVLLDGARGPAVMPQRLPPAPSNRPPAGG